VVLKVFTVVWVIAILTRLANFYLMIMVTTQLMNTPNAARLGDHPQFPLLALSIALSNVFESLCFIPSTFFFLYHIASKLEVNGRALLVSLFMEHQGVDYVLLVGTKMYIMVGAIVILVVGGQDNTTNPVINIIAWSHTLAIVTFMGSSFRTAQALISQGSSISANEKSKMTGASQRRTSYQE
jgi:hypothetical protein